MRTDDARDTADELPAPSAELVLIRVLVQAHISTIGRKRADRYIRLVSETLVDEENISAVFNIRPSSQQGAVRVARKKAAAIWERYLPVFLAALGR